MSLHFKARCHGFSRIDSTITVQQWKPHWTYRGELFLRWGRLLIFMLLWSGAWNVTAACEFPPLPLIQLTSWMIGAVDSSLTKPHRIQVHLYRRCEGCSKRLLFPYLSVYNIFFTELFTTNPAMAELCKRVCKYANEIDQIAWETLEAIVLLRPRLFQSMRCIMLHLLHNQTSTSNWSG